MDSWSRGWGGVRKITFLVNFEGRKLAFLHTNRKWRKNQEINNFWLKKGEKLGNKLGNKQVFDCKKGENKENRFLAERKLKIWK